MSVMLPAFEEVLTDPPAQAMSVKPASTAAPQYNREGSEQEMVPVGPFFLYRGTFTVHASHPLKFTSGFHQFSYAAGYHSHDHGEMPTLIKDAAGLDRLGDKVHKFTFVAEGAKHSVGY